MKNPPADLAARLRDCAGLILSRDEAPRFEDVARETGVSRATLYYYFAGREDLVAFVLRMHVEEGARAMRAADDEEAPPEQRLHAVLRAAVDHLAERPLTCLGLLGAAGASGRMQDVLELNDRLVAAPLRALLEHGTSQGTLDAPDAWVAGDVLLGALMLGVVGAYGRSPGEESGGLDHRGRSLLVDQLVRGVLAADQPLPGQVTRASLSSPTSTTGACGSGLRGS